MSPLDAGTASPPPDIAARTFVFTLGKSATQRNWTECRRATWLELAARLTKHEVGPKEGPCFVPAIFRGTARKMKDAAQIDLAVLDSDCGHTLEEIKAALEACDWAAFVHSTHSHLTTHTTVKASHWEKFVREFPADAVHLLPDAERLFLIEKGYLPHVAEGARLGNMTADEVTFEHAPCPKFRIVLRLSRPWRAADYADQATANAAWKERIEALAAALGLSHDQSCTDTSRLFYLPRHPGAPGQPPVSSVIEGADCDIWSLPLAAKPAHACGLGGTKFSTADDAGEFTDPETGECIDLRKWAREHGRHFEIVKALRARTPESFIGYVAEGTRHHIKCVNEDAHTSADPGRATFIANASEARNTGFVYHCRHAHCTGLDRLFFVKRMLEQGWLKIEDLTLPAFLAPDAGDNLAGDAAAADADAPALPPAFSEERLALRFSDQHAHRLRFVAAWGRWLRWDGTRWAHDDTLAVFDLARAVCRKAAAECNEPRVASRIAAAQTVAAVERLAKADRRHAATVDQWDADPWLLNTPGGAVDLRTGILRPHRPEDHLMKCTSVAPGGGCPRWLAFLDRITAGDADLQRYMQRLAGYCLTGITTEHALFFGYGTGGNGKGRFLFALGGALGDYAATAQMETFTASPTDRHPTDLAMLRGARLVTAQETEEGRRWAEARIKALTGGDPITARFMRQDFFTFLPRFKLFIAGNHKPGLGTVDEAMRRRLHLIPFTVSIPATERDLQLDEKLRDEWAGILAWAIDGCREWQRVGLAPPSAVRDATVNYLEAEDSLAHWIDERCIVSPSAIEPYGLLFASWQAWTAAAGEQAGTQKRFSQSLEARGFIPARRDGARVFCGLSLRPPQGVGPLR